MFDEFRDSLSSQNIFVTQGYSYYFSHTKELQGIAVNQKTALFYAKNKISR